MLICLRILLEFDTSVHYEIQETANALRPSEVMQLYSSSTLLFSEGSYVQLTDGQDEHYLLFRYGEGTYLLR